MKELKRATVQHSLEDVIRILENEPVRGDLIVSLPIVQTMNRISIAHLSIERAMKFLITEAGGPLIKDHDLPSRLQQLRQYAQESANFLDEAFNAAVRHYGYNPNVPQTSNLKTLDTYLNATGSDHAFQDIRYWELDQSMNEVLIRQAHLHLHLEILHGLRKILEVSSGPKDTVLDRVETAVRYALCPSQELMYSSGTEKELSVKSYIQWLQGHATCRDAITEAFRKEVAPSADFMLRMVSNAYKTLAESNDPAVKYFVDILTVLPTQPRDVIPCVEWLVPSPSQVGKVFTPAGTVLGFIYRRPDGLWDISPRENVAIRTADKAETQTDARCFLASLLTRPARTIVNGDEKPLRIVGKEYNLFNRNYDQVAKWYEKGDGTQRPSYQVEFWDDKHGITDNDSVKLEVPSNSLRGVVDFLEGTVTRVEGQRVFISGTESVATVRE